MKDKLSKLLNVKSIITILLAGVFSYLSINGAIRAEQFLTIFTTIIAFYFGVQSTKDNSNK